MMVNSMEKFFNKVTFYITAIGTAVATYYNKMDSLMQVLLVFTILDYIIGVVVAYDKKEVSSSKAWKGFIKKCFNFVIILMAYKLDSIIKTNGMLYAAATLFFLSYEGMSILEHMNTFGITFPSFIQEVLDHIHNSSDKGQLPSTWEPKQETIVNEPNLEEIAKKFLNGDNNG